MKIVLLGSGNVATQLGQALLGAGHEIIQVWSRNIAHAEELANSLNAGAITDLQKINLEAGLYILAVNDDAIAQVSAQLPLSDRLIVHTSGSTEMDVLSGSSGKFGVIYPVQTFSKQKPLDFKTIPVVVEGNSPETTKELLHLAGQISGQTIELNSQKRRALHISAVFACNFTNYLYSISEKILKEEGMDFDLLRPIIVETAAKVQKLSPAEAQTGPGLRNDLVSIKKHLDYLKNDPQLHELYNKLSQGIVNFYHKP